MRLLFLELDGSVVRCEPLIEYFLANMHRSDAWQQNVARALGLYWDYCTSLRSRGVDLEDPSSSFRQFATALLQGTINNCVDELELYWIGQRVSAVRRLLASLEDFINSKQAGTTLESSLTGSAVSTARAKKRARYSLLGYLDGSHQLHPRTDGVLRSQGTAVGLSAPLSFPPAKVEEVLWRGFIRPGRTGASWDDYNLGAMMIYLLQGFAGAREHEPFHLWVNDVVEDPLMPGQALVYLYHPTQGAAYLDAGQGRGAKTNRAQKLGLEYGLPPRTLGTGSYRVGWKSSKVETDDCFAIFQWSDPTAAALFWLLYKKYLPRREALLSARVALGYKRHPFLFVSGREARSMADGEKFLGAPASVESYDYALSRAVRACELPFGKCYGTTSHGLRHLYAYTLRKLGANTKILQEALRHNHPFSCDRYGALGPLEISKSLNEANARSVNGGSTTSCLTATRSWLDPASEDYRNAAFRPRSHYDVDRN